MRFALAIAALAPVLSAYADQLIIVGLNNTLTFTPPNITAQAGETISFQFVSKNHSVTQSTFVNPCAIQTTPAQGIDSGFQFVSNTSATVPQWSFTVQNATTPLWFFCAQTGHCAKGMVFSVNANPTSPRSFAVYQAAAMGNPADVESQAAAAASAVASGVAAATSDAAGDVSALTSAAAGAAGAAATDAAGALTAAAGAASAAANALTGLTGAAPTSAGGNGTLPSAGFRVSGSAMSLVAAVGLGVMLL